MSAGFSWVKLNRETCRFEASLFFFPPCSQSALKGAPWHIRHLFGARNLVLGVGDIGKFKASKYRGKMDIEYWSRKFRVVWPYTFAVLLNNEYQRGFPALFITYLALPNYLYPNMVLLNYILMLGSPELFITIYIPTWYF